MTGPEDGTPTGRSAAGAGGVRPRPACWGAAKGGQGNTAREEPVTLQA